MKLPQNLIASATILLAALIVTGPWPVDGGERFLIPGLVVGVAYYWAVHRPDLHLAWAVFLAGLTVDVASGALLGYWALVYLMGYACGLAVGRAFADRGPLSLWIGYVPVVLVSATVAWAAASVALLTPLSWQPLAQSAALLVLCYPLIAGLLLVVRRLAVGAGVPVRAGGF